MTKLIYAASAAAILSVVGFTPAMAQSSMSAPMITCKDISSMDRETARGVVFYLSGFKAASGSQSASSAGTSGTSGSTGASGSSDTSGSTADAGSGSSGSSDTTTGSSGSSGSTADAGSSGSTTTDTTGSTTSAGGASGGASSAVMAQLPGFSSVDIDKVMSECASSPDKQLSDMMMGSGQ